jgi:hypothetical protein
MGRNTASQRPVAVPDETNLCSVSLVGILDSGELVASVTSVTEQTTTDLTISNTAVSTGELTINNKAVATGKAIQFKVIGQLVANSPYTLTIKVVTDSTPAQTKIKYVKFDVATE